MPRTPIWAAEDPRLILIILDLTWSARHTILDRIPWVLQLV